MAKAKRKPIYVGIDISKDKLDVWVPGKHGEFTNDDEGHDKLVRFLRRFTVEVIVMEATGGPETEVAVVLAEAEYPVAIVNPRQVRDYAKAIGRLAKTDKIVIAQIRTTHTKSLLQFRHQLQFSNELLA